MALAREHGRPFEYLKLRKEDAARKIAERDGIVEGLVCVFSALEPCRTFSLRFTTGQPYVQSAKRKCLHLYYYFIDRDLGLLHVRVQTWFPLQVQVYLNGREWLARKLTARGIGHAKIANVFIRVGDLPRAQRLANRFAHLSWPRILSRYARQVVPQLGGSRIKHRVKQNWLKMYDKAGLVLRIETVINNPEEFRVSKKVLRDGSSAPSGCSCARAWRICSDTARSHCRPPSSTT